MTWRDRLRTAAYTANNGLRVEFQYEDVSYSFEKKTSSFNFPEVNGTYIQDLGNTGRKFPIVAYFSGANNDLEAQNFMNVLRVEGEGVLDHPAYGSIKVVPFGEVRQTNALKTGANQSVINVTFWETTGVLYPARQTDPVDGVFIAISDYNQAASSAYSEAIENQPALEQITQRNFYEDFVNRTKNSLQSVADFSDDVRSQFEAINASINNSIDLFVAQPLSLTFQAIQLIQTPARAAASIAARLDGYRNLLNEFLFNPDGSTKISSNIDDFKTADLFASSYVTGSISSSLNNTFTTRSDAILTADIILEQFLDLVVWRDANFQTLEGIDTGESYQGLQEAVALTAGYLVELSFSLRQERVLVLDFPRTIVDLVAELYGEVDSQLDFFINSNSFSGSEILELPAGKEVRYFV